MPADVFHRHGSLAILIHAGAACGYSFVDRKPVAKRLQRLLVTIPIRRPCSHCASRLPGSNYERQPKPACILFTRSFLQESLLVVLPNSFGGSPSRPIANPSAMAAELEPGSQPWSCCPEV